MKIVFFYYKRQTLGGISLQFYNLCNYLSEHTTHEVCYVDFYNETIAEMAKDANIQYIDVDQFEVHGYEDAVFITSPDYLFFLLQKIDSLKKAKILLYDWNTDSSINLRNQFKNPYIDLAAVYSYIDEKNGIDFMDDAVRMSCQKKLGILPQKRFIPTAKEMNHQVGDSAAMCVECASQTELTVQDLMAVPAIKEQWKSFRKYHKAIDKDYYAFCTEEINKNPVEYEKFQDYFYILCEWLGFKHRGINLEDFFKKNNYSSIAIYGMGYMGHLLYDELKTSDIEIKYGIDNDPNSKCEGLTIIPPGKISEQVDVIVVTPSFAFDEIKEMLSTKTESAIMSINEVLRGIREKRFLSVQDHYEEVLKKIQKKAQVRKIRVAFLVLYTYTFSSLPIYKLMREDDRYETSIIAIPDISKGIDYLRDNYKKTLQELREIDENVIEGYDIASDHYVDIKDDYDLIFFNNPYKNMIKSVHSIEHFLDSDVLTLYVNYGFFTLKFGRQIVRTNFYNNLWKVFIDSNENLEDLKREELIHGKNGVVSGYLKMDSLADADIEQNHRKRVLICPHHTVPDWTHGKFLELSNFLKYAELILELPQKYPELDFIFRPHPFLFYNLVSNRIWSEEEKDLYLEKINQIPNIVYDADGDYFETFANSDAMIHDCGSFTAEYLFTEKPCCYMLKNEYQIQNEFLPMGQECLKHYYKAYEKEDIYKFIEDVVIGEIDPLKAERERFSRESLKFNYPKAAEFAYQYITDLLFNN